MTDQIDVNNSYSEWHHICFSVPPNTNDLWILSLQLVSEQQNWVTLTDCPFHTILIVLGSLLHVFVRSLKNLSRVHFETLFFFFIFLGLLWMLWIVWNISKHLFECCGKAFCFHYKLMEINTFFTLLVPSAYKVFISIIVSNYVN